MAELELPELGLPGLSRRRKRRTASTELPADQESLLSRVGGTALSGLEATGNVLDLVGSSARDVLAGENPLDQWMTPTKSVNRTTGRDLLRKAGLAGKEDTWGNWLAGMGVEIGTDPLTWLGAGGLAKAAGAGLIGGSKAASAGSGVFRAGIPFSKIGTELFTGPVARKAAETVGKQFERIGFSTPMRSARSFLDSSVMGRSTSVGQEAAEKVFGAQGRRQQQTMGLTGEVGRALETSGRATSAAAKALRGELEIPGVAASAEATKLSGALAADSIAKADLGIPSEFLDDVLPGGAKLGYSPRRLNENLVKAAQGTRSPFAGRSPEDAARLQVLKGFTKGTEGVNELFADTALKQKSEAWLQRLDAAKAAGTRPRAIGRLRKQAIDDIQQHITGTHGANIVQQYQPIKNGKSLWLVGGRQKWARVAPQGATSVLKDRHRGLAKIALETPKWFEHTLFPNHPLVDIEHHLISSANRQEAASGLYDAVAKSAQPFSASTKAATTSVAKVFQQLGFRKTAATKQIASRLGIPWTPRQARVIANLRIDKAVADDLLGLWPAYQVPKQTGLLLNTIDSVTSLFKAGVLTWPARYVRDAVSGAIRNFENGWLDPQSFVQSHNLIQGRAVAGLKEIPAVQAWLSQRGLPATDESATEAVKQLYAQHNLSGHAWTDVTSAASPTVDPSLESILGRVPGRTPSNEIQSAANVAKTAVGVGGTLNPLAVRGVGGRTTNTFGPAAAGDMVGKYTDTLNRLSPFINLLKAGMEPAEAIDAINRAQVDYSSRAFTPHERVLKRIFPFYCVPESHEALTETGWKKWDEIHEGELLLTYKQKTGELEWQPVHAVNVFDFDGELIEIHRTRRNRRYSFQFTDDHRWPVKRTVREPVVVRGSNPNRKQIVDDKITIRLGSELRTGDRLQCAGDFRGTYSILSPRLAAILGWVVTDGYFRWKGNGKRSDTWQSIPGFGSCEMLVYQSPGKHLDTIVKLLGTAPRPPHPETGVCAVPVAREDIVELCKVFRCKRDLLRIVSRLSREAAEAMWEAMFLAEGVTNPETGQQHFAQSAIVNHEVLDAFQILCLLTGRTANLSGAGAYIRKRNCYQVDRKNLMRRVQYTGKIWCPTTPNGTWVMRHDGQVVITGNSFTKQQLAYVAKELMANPGGRLGAIIKTTNRLRDDGGVTPDYVAQTMAVPLGESETGDKRYLTGLGMMHEDPLSFLGGGVRGGLLETASRANPLIKAPLEWMTNQSFFQTGPEGGRPLGDLDPTVGRTLTNIGNLTGLTDSKQPVRFPGSDAAEFIVGNSPLSRLLTTARQATDTRKSGLSKAANLLTGIRVTDISPAAQDAVIRERAQEAERRLGGKSFIRSYIPSDVLAAMSPAEKEDAMRLQSLLNTLSARTKERKKATAQ